MADDINAALGIPSSPSASVEATAPPMAHAYPTIFHKRKGEESSSEFIQRVRGQTCYSTLRGFITFFSVVSGIVWVISAIVCTGKGLSDQNGLLVLLGIGGGVLGLFIIIASQQAASLSIDIADTLIEQTRKKSRDHDTSA